MGWFPSIDGTRSAIFKFLRVAGFFEEYDNGNSGTSKTITWANGQKQKLTLTGNVTLTFDWAGCPVGAYQLRVIQDGAGGRTIAAGTNLPGAGYYIGATGLPQPTTTASSVSVYTFIWNGTTALGAVGYPGVSPGYQPLDSTLTAWAAITTAANKLHYSDGVDSFASCDFTAQARALLAASTTLAQVRALGVTPTSFTPYIAGSTTEGVNTYSVQSGYSFALGDLRFVAIRVTMTAKGTAGNAMAGDVVVKGLPDAAPAANPIANLTLGNYSGITLNSGYTQLATQVQNGASYVALRQVGSNVSALAIPVTSIADSTQIMLTGWYSTSWT